MASSRASIRTTCAVLAIALASSCDYIFRLDRIDDPMATGDAGPCTPRGHDEDQDDLDDACDSCPQLGVAQTDSDGDQIGDACDPNPSDGGDALVQFYAFDTTEDNPAWNLDPEWTFDAENLVFTGIATESSAVLLDPVVVPPFEVQVGVTLDGVDLAQRAYLIVNGNAGSGIKLECSPDHVTPTNDIVTAYTHSVDASGYDESALPTNSYAPGKLFQVRLTAHTGINPRMICEFDGGLARSATALINAPPSTTPTFYLHAKNSVLRVHWLAIYSIPPDL